MVMRKILDDAPVTLSRAYKDLSRPAFGIWIMLMVLNKKFLDAGRKVLFKKLGYKITRGSELLRELKHKGYIQIDSAPYTPIKVIIIKRAKISGPNRFVILTDKGFFVKSGLVNFYFDHVLRREDLNHDRMVKNAISMSFPPLVPIKSENVQKRYKFLGCIKEPKKPRKIDYKSLVGGCSKICLESPSKKITEKGTTGRGVPFLRKKMLKIDSLGRFSNSYTEESQIWNKKAANTVYTLNSFNLSSFNHSSFNHNHTLGTVQLPFDLNNTLKKEKNKNTKRTDKVTFCKLVKEKNTKTKDKNLKTIIRKKIVKEEKTNEIDLNLFKKIHMENKEKRSEIAKKREETKKKNKEKKITPVKIDWKKMDQNGKPSVSFEPTDEEREKLLKILRRPHANLTKKAITRKLGSEFSKIYTRYRKTIQNASGNVQSYMTGEKERKYAERAAVSCIEKSVTPRQVLSYWHHNISNFANSNMKVPPLVFLSGPANIDTVACSFLDGEEDFESRQATFENHSFSDVTKLHPGIREGLIKAGFESVRQLDDRFLLTVQEAASAISNGHNLFVDEDLKKMVDFVAENIFGGVKNDLL